VAALSEAEAESAALEAHDRDAIAIDVATSRARCLLFLGRAAEMLPVLLPHREALERLEPSELAAPYYVYLAMSYAILGNRRGVAEIEAPCSSPPSDART